MARLHIILVHGAYHQPWHLHPLTKILEDTGYSVTVPHLPCASANPPQEGLEADVEVIKDALQKAAREADGIVALCHSYGGVVLSEAVAEVGEEAQKKIRRLIYLAAFVPPTPGFTVRQGGQAFPWEATAPDDTLSIVEDPRSMFYHDVEPQLAAEAVAKVVPHANKCFSTPTKHAGWRPYPCAFVITTEDRAAEPALIRWMLDEVLFKDPGVKARWEVHELASSHSPFLSMPSDCATIIKKYAGE